MKILRNLKIWLPGVLIVVLLIGLIGSTYAKYVKKETREGTVTIKANLGKIELLEHEAVDPEVDGEYILDMTQEVTNNTYKLLPGLDIPKDPFVRITNKSPIEAYVFVKMVTNIVTDKKDAKPGDTLDSDFSDDHNISYSLTDNWILISSSTDETTKVTTAVYVYKTVVDETFGTNGDGNGTIPILVGDIIEVSQKLNAPKDGVYMNFSACMYEVASGDSVYTVGTVEHAKSVYSNNTTP